MNPLKNSQPIEEGAKVSPSPAALAFVNRLTDEDWSDVYRLAHKIDEVAEQARQNERWRIFHMSFSEMMREFWKGRKWTKTEK